MVFVRGAHDWVGSIDVKGSIFGISYFFVFVGDWWTGEGIRDGWMDGNREGIGGMDLGPLSLFFPNGAGSRRRKGQCCTFYFFPKMQPTHRRLFSGTTWLLSDVSLSFDA